MKDYKIIIDDKGKVSFSSFLYQHLFQVKLSIRCQWIKV